jgi:hypothetical protein
VQASLVSFRGSYGNIDYPASFTVAAREASKGSYVDTTITSPANPSLLIRLDVLPTTDTTPDPNAARVRQALANQPGYRQLQFIHTPVGGYNAIRWEFLVQEHGVLLHKVDTFFIDNSADEVAILTQAPASIYARWSLLFRRIQSSFSESGTPIAGPQPPPQQAAPPSPPAAAMSFCDTHTCISNFDNGNGYIVQCADGEWSQSGGLSGACSYHGGETSNVYGPP